MAPNAGKGKKQCRKKKGNTVCAEEIVGRVLLTYGLEVGCSSHLSDPRHEGSNVDASERLSGFEVVFPKRQKKPHFDQSFLDLHLHSTCSDGLLSPASLVRKAAANGVRIMALSDHDTMAGVEDAAAAGAELGVRVIPGVEISAFASKPSDSLQGEVVHILAYFPPGGPTKAKDFHRALSKIRNGRVERAKSMVSKLRALGKTIELSRVIEIAGSGVAPGRPHVARALVEAGHVATEGDAFKMYLTDNGPAFARGCEMPALEVLPLIRRCGGLSVLAHPWSIRSDVMGVVGRLAGAGLDGMEVYQDSTKIATYSPLADLYGLTKAGGSDFHGTGAADERVPGRIPLPAAAAERILLAAKPIWEEALQSTVRGFVAEERGSGTVVREEEGSCESPHTEQDCPTHDQLKGANRGHEEDHLDDRAGACAVEPESGDPKFVTWTVTERDGSRTLVTPLLLTDSERNVVRAEAKRLRCRVIEAKCKGYECLAIAPG